MNSKAEETEDADQTLTYAYGHTVGKGVQDIFENKSLESIIWEAYVSWGCDLFQENTKQNKSFWGAIQAIRQLYSAHQSGFLADYELVYWQGKPACELSFLIRLPDGFIYRGFVDAVLRHKTSGKVIVLECKTTSSARENPAKYKNSAQAIGYSIVLDALFPELSSYEVLYLIYQTKSTEWTTIPFQKSYFQRALWIRELLLDVEMIKLYEAAQIYPMHGESCYDFFRECEYLQHCTLPTQHLIEPLTQETIAKIEEELAGFQIKIGIDDLIQAQLSKNTTQPAVEITNADGDELL